jgi:large-conductance mechanosensitive channel
MYGHFLSVLLDFIVIAGVVYFGIKGLKLDNLDKKK